MNGSHSPYGWVFLIVVLLGLSAAVSSAQSLAELAKKEKERRSKLKSEGNARVITDRELKRSALPESLPSSAPATGQGEQAAGSAAGTEGEAEEAQEPEETKTREYWQQRTEAVQTKIEDLENELESPEMNWGGGIRNDVNPIGQRNLSRRQELERQLAEARAELEAIREEARRAGVPGGWVR